MSENWGKFIYGRQVIVGVNYIISNQQCYFGAKKNYKMAIYDDSLCNLLYLSNLIGVTTCHYACIITPQFYQMCPDPIFRQGRRARMKNLVSGEGTETGTETKQPC